MSRIAVAAVVVCAFVAALVVVAFGFAAADDNNDRAEAEATAVPTATPTPLTSIVPPPPTVTPVPPPAQSPETPVPSRPPLEPTMPLPFVPPAPQSPPAPAPPSPPAPTPTLTPGTQIVGAPIDGADVRVLESFPPQYVLNVKAGLPSGCARRHSHDVSRSGNTFTVRVLNTIPVGQAVCTAIYGIYDLNIPLPGPFQSGARYTVVVNDKTVTFTAQ